MKLFLMGVVGGCSLLLFILRLHAISGSSAEYQAFLQRDNIEMSGSFEDFQQDRWGNHLKYKEGMFPVDTIVKVTVATTEDTHDSVITVTNVNGEIASLWLTGDSVSGLTNY